MEDTNTEHNLNLFKDKETVKNCGTELETLSQLKCAEFCRESNDIEAGFESIESINEWIIIDNEIKEEIDNDKDTNEECIYLTANDENALDYDSHYVELRNELSVSKCISSSVTKCVNENAPSKKNKSSTCVNNNITEENCAILEVNNDIIELPISQDNTASVEIDSKNNQTSSQLPVVDVPVQQSSIPVNLISGQNVFQYSQQPKIQQGQPSAINTNYISSIPSTCVTQSPSLNQMLPNFVQSTLPLNSITPTYIAQVPNTITGVQTQNVAFQLPSGQIVPISNNTGLQYGNNGASQANYFCVLPNSTSSITNNAFNIAAPNISYQVLPFNNGQNIIAVNNQQPYIQASPSIYNNNNSAFIQSIAQVPSSVSQHVPTYVITNNNNQTKKLMKREIFPKDSLVNCDQRNLLKQIARNSKLKFQSRYSRKQVTRTSTKPLPLKPVIPTPSNQIISSLVNGSATPSTTYTMINQSPVCSTVPQASNIFQMLPTPSIQISPNLTTQMNMFQQQNLIPQLSLMAQPNRISHLNLISQQQSQVIPQLNSVSSLNAIPQMATGQNFFSIQPNNLSFSMTPSSNMMPLSSFVNSNVLLQATTAAENLHATSLSPNTASLSNIKSNHELPNTISMTTTLNPNILSFNSTNLDSNSQTFVNSVSTTEPITCPTISGSSVNASDNSVTSVEYKLISFNDPSTNSQFYKLVPINEDSPPSEMESHNLKLLSQLPIVDTNKETQDIEIPAITPISSNVEADSDKFHGDNSSSDVTPYISPSAGNFGITFVPKCPIGSSNSSTPLTTSETTSCTKNLQVSENEVIILDSSDECDQFSNSEIDSMPNEDKDNFDNADDDIAPIDRSLFENIGVPPLDGDNDPVDEVFSCRYCDKIFYAKLKLDNHIQNIHPENKVFVCASCDAQFTNMLAFKLHLKNHRRDAKNSLNDTPLKCSFCNKQVLSLQRLKLHLKTHNNQNRYSCAHCEKSFTTKGYIKIHMRKHNNEKPYCCYYCNKRFVENSQLHSHIRIHTNYKPFTCYYCKKSFTMKSTLVQHMNTHTKRKPYRCKRCNKHFRQKRNIFAHYRCVHKNLYPEYNYVE